MKKCPTCGHKTLSEGDYSEQIAEQLRVLGRLQARLGVLAANTSYPRDGES